MVRDLYYKSLHYNVSFKSGVLRNRVTEHDLCGLRAADIAFVWVVEEKRNATPEEIRKLCKKEGINILDTP
jgi:hypothetical protein